MKAFLCTTLFLLLTAAAAWAGNIVVTDSGPAGSTPEPASLVLGLVGLTVLVGSRSYCK